MAASFALHPLVRDLDPISAAQALGSELYLASSNGDLVRVDHTRQTIPGQKPIDDIVILPSLSRLLVLADHQIFFYTLPSLDLVNIKPIRNVLAFAVDHRHLQRPPVLLNDAVEFSVISRTGIAMFSFRNDKLFYQKDIPLPQGSPLALTAKRIGQYLCFADNEYYNMVDLDQASLFQLLPLRQTPDPTPWPVEPLVTVIGETEFLVTSWTGSSALGLFITGDGDPVRGTLQWSRYPKAVCKSPFSPTVWILNEHRLGLDYPYIMSLLPDDTIQVHSVETQSIVQELESSTGQMIGLVPSLHGFFVPSSHRRSEKMRKVMVQLVRDATN